MGKNIILKTLLSFMVLCMSLSASSQILQSVGVVKSHGGDKAKSVAIKKKSNQKKLDGLLRDPKKKDTVTQKSVGDTIYCTITKKLHGWYLPLDTISKEIASHRFCSFRFTNKYPSGYWGKMETVDGYGRLTTTNMSPYILKISSAKSDKSANQDWVEKLQTSCIYEFIADPTGKVIVQERAYDKDMNLIYTYSRVPRGNGVYIGSYKDAMGLPAEMRKEPSFSYGTLVRLTEDKWGNDSIVEYIDSKGKTKPNSDGAAMEVFVYDKFGNLLKQQSRDVQGNLVIDNCGNCGFEVVWTPDHKLLMQTCMDANWQPMEMPDNNRTDEVKNGAGVIRTYYRYDKYSRQIEETFFTDQDVAAVNHNGIHKICYEYNEKGDRIKQMNLGLNNELVEDAIGMALSEYKFDKEGRNIECVFLNKDRQPRSNHDYFSKIVNEYDEEGNLVKEEQFAVLNGKEHVCYKKVNLKNAVYYQWEDGTTRVDSLDVKGRIFSETYRDSLGNLSDKDNHYAIHQYQYTDLPKKTIIKDYYLDKDRILCNPTGQYAKCVCVVDTIHSRKYSSFNRNYDVNGELVESYILEFVKSSYYGDVRRTAQYDTNAFGVACRSGGSFGVRHYKCDVAFSASDDKLSTLVGRDEFGEPDYISSLDETYYYTKLNPNGENQRLDENNYVIKDQSKFKDECPKVMSIEIVDSMAYQLGLRDNDVILVDGSYVNDVLSIDSTIQSFYDFRKIWTLHSVLNGMKNRSMIVFRVNPETLEYGLVKIDGLKGTPSELGYMAHIRYLTQKQLKRIQNSVMLDMASNTPLIKREKFKSVDCSGNNYVLLGFADFYRSIRNSPYAKQVTDPAVVLGFCSAEYNKKWTSDNGEDTDAFDFIHSSRKQENNNYSKIDYFFSKNASSITHLTLNDKALWVNLFDARVSDECYAQLRDLYMAAKDSVDLILKNRKTMPSKNFVGIWITKSTSKYTPEAHLQLKKDGSMSGVIKNYGQVEFSDRIFECKIEQVIKGNWRNGEHFLFYEIMQSDTTVYSIVETDLEKGQQDGEQREFRNIQNKKLAEYLLSKINYPIGKLSMNWFISKLSKQNMVVALDSIQNVILERTNVLPKVEFKENVLDASPLIGYWKRKDSNMPNSTEEFYFKENGEFGMNFMFRVDSVSNDTIPYVVCLDMELTGMWHPTRDGIRLTCDSILNSDVYLEAECSDMKLKNNIEKQVKKLYSQQANKLMSELVYSTKIFGEEIGLEVVDSAKINFGGLILMRKPINKGVVMVTVEDDSAYLAKNGFSGDYVLLQWCNWNCTQSLDEFSAEFEKQKEHDKYLVLLPWESKGNEVVYGNVIEIYCPKGMLGVRLQDLNVYYGNVQREIVSRYKEFKRNKE